MFREQAQIYIGDPASSDSRRGLKRSWTESNNSAASSDPVAGSSSDGQRKLTSAEKGIAGKSLTVSYGPK